MAGSRQEEALTLAEELLGDIELRRITSTDIVRKASRLARLTDDADALKWLHYELVGYGEGVGERVLDDARTEAALRSGRRAPDAPDGSSQFWTATLGQMEANIASNRAVLPTLGGNVEGQWAPTVENQRAEQRRSLTEQTAKQQEIVDKVVGAIYVYIDRLPRAPVRVGRRNGIRSRSARCRSSPLHPHTRCSSEAHGRAGECVIESSGTLGERQRHMSAVAKGRR